MTVRASGAFGHLPQGTTVGAAPGYGGVYNGWGITFASSNSGNGSSSSIFPQAGGIQFNSNSGIATNGTAGGSVTLAYALAGMTDGTSRKSIFGMAVLVNPAQTLGLPLLQLCGVSFNHSECGIQTGVSNFVEAVVDRLANTVTIWNGSKLLITKPATTSLYSSGNSLTVGGGNAGAANQVNSFNMTTFYFIDDTQNDTPCDRLGPCTANLLSLLAADGVGYTTSTGGTVVDALNTAMTSIASLTAPLVNTPTSMAPLSCSFNTAMDQYASIKSVNIIMTAKKNPATDTSFKLGFTLGSQSVSGNAISFSDTNLKYNQAFGSMDKDPTGTPWTLANLLASKLTITPTPLVP